MMTKLRFKRNRLSHDKIKEGLNNEDFCYEEPTNANEESKENENEEDEES